MNTGYLLSIIREISPILALIFMVASAILLYLLKLEKKKNGGILAPDTVIIDPGEETSMTDEYDAKDILGNPTHPYKIALRGQEGAYQDLDILLPQLQLWYNRGLKFVDFRFSVVQAPRPNTGKFTAMVVPVGDADPVTGERKRLRPGDLGTGVDVRAVDLGDLHP